MRFILLVLVSVLSLSACSSEIKDLIDTARGIRRKPIDTTRMGINAFADKREFGSVCEQYAEVSSVLGLNYVRILFNWNDAVQPSPRARINWGFYDEKLNCLPDGTDALIVVNGVPSWMANRGNWICDNPRTTFAELWARRVVERYAGSGRVIGWQIWNEPNMVEDPENVLMEMAENPENYVELLAHSYSIAKSIAPGKLVVSAATTAICQNFPDSLNYNRQMRDAGAENFMDVWAIHFYGEQFERVVVGGGVRAFLNGVQRVIWITESGAMGVNNQLAYVETAWPYLREQIPGIDRIYYYQFASVDPPDITYGLRTLDPELPISDLYVFLRDR